MFTGYIRYIKHSFYSSERLLLYITIILLTVISCQKEPDDPEFVEEEMISIAGFLEKNKENYSKFYRLATEADMMIPLSAFNPFGDGFTLFLPTDDAFDRFITKSEEYENFNELIRDTTFIHFLGRYHIVNASILSNDFTYGALPEETATGDQLIIGFSTNLDSMVYKVNSVAPIIDLNLEMVNGYIHIISEVLQPVTISGYEWLKQNEGYTILTEALKITGLKNRLGTNNSNTLLAEHDSIFNKFGIFSMDDLIDEFATHDTPFDDFDNSLYQFAAYHIIRWKYFLSDFDWGENEYRTYAKEDVRIAIGQEIRINPGKDTLRLEITELGDTTFIDYIQLYWEQSNILTKTGPIHFISDILYSYKPSDHEND